MADIFRAACVQLNSGNEIDANVAAAVSLIRAAHADGADFILTPETTSLMEMRSKFLFEKISEEKDDRALATFRALANELSVWLLIGSLAIKLSQDKVANRSFLIAPDGSIAARYDKIHMFDVDLPGGESYRESKNYQPGGSLQLATLPWGTVGLSICYDLRFPALYRGLAQGGAQFLTVPAAFTRVTGEAHWHILLRSRAIENGCYLFAPAQCGTHDNGRQTYGHSLIIDPWGEVLAEAGVEAGFICADIDPAAVAEARGRVPSLQHDRPFSLNS